MIPVIPKGTHLLLRIVSKEEATESGIIVSSSKDLARENVGNDITEVMAIGNLAYKNHPQHGDMEPLCEVGDFIMTQRYPGHKFEFPVGSGQLWYLAQDDDVKAVVPKEIVNDLNRK